MTGKTAQLAKPIRCLAALLLAQAAAIPAAVAQGNDSSTTPSLSQGNGGTSQNPPGGIGPVAPVGAGTTDAVTTGRSGTEPEPPSPVGEIDAPPLPSAAQCESWADTPAYRNCLAVVLRGEVQPQ